MTFFRTATEVAAGLRRGALSSRELTEQLFARIDASDVNAVVATRRGFALEAASRADATTGGPLHGVPMTIKDSFSVDGMPQTGGYPHRRNFRQTRDAPVVARMREAGAIVIGLGNTCGFLIWIESNNPLYGRVSCAYDETRTAGGSSGGDGAIVGIDHFGASAPAGTIFAKLGFTPERVADVARGVARSGLRGRIATLDPGHQPAGLGVGEPMPTGPQAVATGAHRAGGTRGGDPGVDRTSGTDPGHS